MAGATRAFNGVRLVWGCESFGPGFGQGLDPADSDAALAALVEWGCVELDTARIYGMVKPRARWARRSPAAPRSSRWRQRPTRSGP